MTIGSAVGLSFSRIFIRAPTLNPSPGPPIYTPPMDNVSPLNVTLTGDRFQVTLPSSFDGERCAIFTCFHLVIQGRVADACFQGNLLVESSNRFHWFDRLSFSAAADRTANTGHV